jgi:hypothetical protein
MRLNFESWDAAGKIYTRRTYVQTPKPVKLLNLEQVSKVIAKVSTHFF